MKTLVLVLCSAVASSVLFAQVLRPGGVNPPVRVTAPVTEEEARLIADIQAITGKIKKDSVPSGEEVALLREAVGRHFDYLTKRLANRLDELEDHVGKARNEARRRETSREQLVGLEAGRLLAEHQSVGFYPDALSLLKNAGAPRPGPSQRGVRDLSE